MGEKISFTKYENQILPGFREKINKAESTEDVKKSFYYKTKQLLDSIFEGQLDLDYEDLQLLPDSDSNYRLSKRVLASPAFISIWKDSDISHVINRMAQAAGKRFRHLAKQPEKTETKIRR